MPKREREQEVAAQFLEHVKDHVFTVQLDSGVHRHIVCKQPGTFNRYFTITTWPGKLCISGDMGTFVFSRMSDMFEFFRHPRGNEINPGYWREKLVAIETDLKRYTYHFLWCCHAIVWAIAQYDARLTPTPEARDG